MNILEKRFYVSTALFIVFVLEAITGVLLFLNRKGFELFRNNYLIVKIHTLFGFLMIFLVFVHLYLNYSMYLSEMKSVKRRE